jgi:branched-chain amino acid transport system permease protein
MGINTTFYKVATFAGSAFFTGIAGALFAYFLNSISAHTVETALTLRIISICIVGGMGTITGAFGGAYLLMFLMYSLNEIARFLASVTGIQQINEAYKIFEDIFYFGVIIIVMLFMPNGIVTSIIKNMDKIKLKFKKLVTRGRK